MGGFSGSDPSPTLAQFEQWVKEGDITYYIAGGGMGGGPAARAGSARSPRGSRRTSRRTIGGETVYLLLHPKS